MTSDHPIDVDLARSASLPTSRASTPTLKNCERLRIVEADLRKYSIMHSNVSHTINAIASFAQDDDLELAVLYTRQNYLYDRQQAAVSEINTLPRCDTPGCQVHSIPLNSPTKTQVNNFPELSKVNRPKRKESEDGFTSPPPRHTTEKANLEFKNFNLETRNKFTGLNENNNSDMAGNSQHTATQNSANINNNSGNINVTAPNTLPPPVFLNIEKHYMTQLKALTEVIPSLRSKKTGEH
ncbi:hypothetical protein TNIN_373931 [Trichonephila inaurata madagascariensis]|uniref:Uncharacterized protein n=1 Tax=Trichonephila inaurata madagascariensis TaxID=2747483 RepID=A0A8X6IS18_9ARAC|nr:hypothetical protein TNIN_373931 [Trichonephila inaurata madagascariensis]